MAALLRWLFSSPLGMKVVTAGYTDCGCDERHRATSAVCVSCVCVSARARVRRCMEWWAGRGAASAWWTSCARVWRKGRLSLGVRVSTGARAPSPRGQVVDDCGDLR